MSSLSARVCLTTLLYVCAALAADAPPLPDLDLQGFDDHFRGQAETALERARSQPDDPDAAGSLGMLLHAMGRLQPAAACYARASALSAGAFRWGYYHGAVLQDLHQRQEALEALQQVRENSGDYAPFHVRLGELLREEKQFEAAEVAFRKALDLEPELPSAHFGLGRVLADQSRWEEAIPSYERAVATARNYTAAYYALGLAYRRVGATEKAKQALDRYQQLKPLDDPTFDPLLDAVSALVGGEVTDAGRELSPQQRQAFADELVRLVEANPGLISAHTNLIALYWQLGQPDKARHHYQAAIEIAPDHADAHYNWGGIAMARGDQQAALQAFDKTLVADPAHVNALVQSGLLIERAGRGAEAERRYRAALAVNPTQRQANYLLARRLVGRGEYAEAAKRLEEAVRIEDQSTPSYLRALAATYVRAGRVDDAKKSLQRAVAMAESLGRADVAAQVQGDLERLP